MACVLWVVDARKTYMVKDKITSGAITVGSPRVMGYDC